MARHEYVYPRFLSPLVIDHQADVAELIRDGIFFGQPLTFEPPDAPERVGQADWENLSISYDRERRPIIVWRHSRGALLASDIAEAIEVLSSADAPGVSDLVERLQNSSVVYAFEVSEDSLSDDAWTMLDALEAHLARTCDGIVYAPAMGFSTLTSDPSPRRERDMRAAA